MTLKSIAFKGCVVKRLGLTPPPQLAGIWLGLHLRTAGVDVGDLQYREQQLEGVLDVRGAIAALQEAKMELRDSFIVQLRWLSPFDNILFRLKRGNTNYQTMSRNS